MGSFTIPIRRALIGLSAVCVCVLTACGMSVKVVPFGEKKHPENPDTDLRFYKKPLDWMDPVVIIGVKGVKEDMWEDVRARARKEAAKHGAEAILVVREANVEGQYTKEVSRYTSDTHVTIYYKKVILTHPESVYIGVRRGKPK